MHEVQGGLEQPSVIAAGADLITRFRELDKQLTKLTHPLGARESIFIGQVSSGEIYNQSPTEFKLQGTRRWLPGNLRDYVEKQFQDILKEVGAYEEALQSIEDELQEGAGKTPTAFTYEPAKKAAMGMEKKICQELNKTILLRS